MAEAYSFRDRVSTVEADGRKRNWMYPRFIKGKLHKYRNIVSNFLLILFLTGPFIKVNGEQLILLNVLERRFAFFGLVFSPQDFYLFVLGMLIFIIFVVVFTVIYGRVFCGWVCPQTIFMEMVFRRIERWIEGDGIKQKKFDQSPMTANKFFRKTLKHSVFILISFIISNIFLAYVISSDKLFEIIREPISQHVTGFIAIWAFTGAFYLVFAHVRELVCTVACPYGRLQGVLLDDDSMVVAYDYVRGEPRGKLVKNKKSATEAADDRAAKGDCIDCGLCVQVCPTGIDIRNGTQLECINCTMCIDACDSVMDKIDRPRRLIGFMSENQIKHRTPFKAGKRIYGYAAVLVILISVLGFLVLRRTDIETRVLRAGGTIYQVREDGTVSNLYNAELVNKTSKPISFTIKPEDPNVKIQYIRNVDRLDRGASTKITFFVIQKQSDIKKYKSDIRLNIISDDKTLERVKTTFIAPAN